MITRRSFFGLLGLGPVAAIASPAEAKPARAITVSVDVSNDGRLYTSVTRDTHMLAESFLAKFRNPRRRIGR